MAHATTIGYVGRRMRRIEDDKLLRGRGVFTDDLHLPGMVHLAFVRCPHAHAYTRDPDRGRRRRAGCRGGLHMLRTALADLVNFPGFSEAKIGVITPEAGCGLGTRC